MHLSLIIPAYNEGKVLKQNLSKIISYLEGKKYSWEIVVVDDGSRDNTLDIAKSFKNEGVKAYQLEPNRGKGGALKEGFDKAAGEYLIFMDADLSVPLKNIDIFLGELKNNDVVIGSRRVEGSDIVVHQPLVRESMGKVYTLLTKIVTATNLADYTCGFKGFKNDVGKRIFKSSHITRWSYDAEIMFLAHKFGYKIKQIPVEWFNRVDSRVRLGSAAITSFADLIKIRIYDLLGKYV